MILEHYSSEPLELWPMSYIQHGYDRDGCGKPNGLWVSVKGENDWRSWCEGESFRPENLAVCHRVTLSDAANIKMISSAEELFAFDDHYGVDWQIGDSKFSLRRIDWQRVAKDYDGVIIAPYIWSCRLGFDSERRRISDWYYPWDCASGCIWNMEAIASFEATETEEEYGNLRAEG